ncbi:MAG: serine hydrolase domain-containing protein [Pseudomonadota bacterium]
MTFTLDPDRLARITPWAQAYVDNRKFAGVSVLVAQHGQEVFFEAFGARDIEAGTPFERSTVARIYSMTKPITSLVFMMLLEEGRVHLNMPLSDVLPQFAEPNALVHAATRIDQTEPCPVPTLHQLLTHRSGFSYPFNPGVLPAAMGKQDLMFKPHGPSLTAQCAALARLPLAFSPGARWEYSVGIDVIGRVIEVVTGQPLDVVFAQRVFDPLGMSDTAFRVPDHARDRFAALYTPLAGDAMDLGSGDVGADTLRCVDKATASPFLDPTCLSGGGGLVGTLDDYMRFAECMRQGGQGLVSRSIADFMMSNHLPGDIASLGPASFAELPMHGVGFGVGGAVNLDPARSSIPGSVADFSWGGMASTFFWIDRVHEISAILFTQLSPSSSYPARAELKALVHGALM